MAIRSFREKSLERYFKNGSLPRKAKWGAVASVTARKLDICEAAAELKDLASPPGNRLEPLHGDLEGYYSIRINDQWRLIFKWTNQGPADVYIDDYHRG